MTEILSDKDLKVGQFIDIIAYCSHVEVSSNLRSQGSFREEYHFHGSDGSYLKGIVFKYDGQAAVDVEEFKNIPVLVRGYINSYLNQLQVQVREIHNISDKLDAQSLLDKMRDDSPLNELTDLVSEAGGTYFFTRDTYALARGLNDPSLGALVRRMYKFLRITQEHYPVEFAQILPSIGLFVNYLGNTECTLNDKLDFMSVCREPAVTEMLFQTGEFPEHVECAKLFALIFDPKG